VKDFINKFKGGHDKPTDPQWSHIFFCGVCGFLAIGLLAWLTESGEHSLILGSFGASCVLLFGYPDSPFSQPRNIVFGHTMSTLVGLIILYSLGVHWWSMSLAVSLAIILMMRFGVMHPPAGSNPLIVFLLQPSWKFALNPTLEGALVLVILGLLLINLRPNKQYPKYW
jgi:CBS-domain-containing membrane protein